MGEWQAVVGAIVLAFLVGLSAGVYLGRRSSVTHPPTATTPPLAGSTMPAGPTKRGRKAGLTEESFTPSDDILERLRRAAVGEIDPADLTGDRPDPEVVVDEEPAVDPELAEAQRRVLDRLERQGDQPSDSSKQRDNGDSR